MLYFETLADIPRAAAPLGGDSLEEQHVRACLLEYRGSTGCRNLEGERICKRDRYRSDVEYRARVLENARRWHLEHRDELAARARQRYLEHRKDPGWVRRHRARANERYQRSVALGGVTT